MNKKSRPAKSVLAEYLFVVLMAVSVAFIFRSTVAQSYWIPSESMEKTLLVGDHLFAEKISKRLRTPERGEILVFQNPQDKKVNYIKRVIGLPGETLEILGSDVYINGKLLDEPYVNTGAYLPFEISYYRFGPVVIPEGHVFMMGDNRFNSSDSRVWGPLDIKLINGRAIFVYWSWKDKSYSVRWDRLGKLL